MMRVPDSYCTACKHPLTGATEVNTGADPGPPTPGCYTFCIYCGHLMVFGDDLRLRDLKPDEVDEIEDIPDLLRVMQTLATMRRKQ